MVSSKKKKRRRTQKATHPLDMITQILSRLPIKSLLCFKVVSNTFKALISSPEFSTTATPEHLLILSSATSATLYAINLFSPTPTESTIPLPSSFVNATWCYHTVDIVGSCNGLLCLSSYLPCCRVIVLNPCTQTYKTLPLLKLPAGTVLIVRFGFGYDYLHDDYKVVRIIDYEGEKFREVAVYSLKEDKWTLVSNGKCAIGEFIGGDYRCKKGVFGVLVDNYLLHWHVRMVSFVLIFALTSSLKCLCLEV